MTAFLSLERAVRGLILMQITVSLMLWGKLAETVIPMVRENTKTAESRSKITGNPQNNSRPFL
jgi:hypothetical protein